MPEGSRRQSLTTGQREAVEKSNVSWIPTNQEVVATGFLELVKRVDIRPKTYLFDREKPCTEVSYE